MIDYMEAMVDTFSTKFKPSDTASSPAAEDLFAEGEGGDLERRNIIPLSLRACSPVSEQGQTFTLQLRYYVHG